MKKYFLLKRLLFVILFLLLTTHLLNSAENVKVYVMAGQSNMEGHNTPQSRLEELISYTLDSNYEIAADELTDLFLDTVLLDYNEAVAKYPGSEVVNTLLNFLYKTGKLEIPAGIEISMEFDFTDRVFKTISEYYYNGTSYAYGYDAFKLMSSAMGIYQIYLDNKLTGGLIQEKEDVTVLQYQGQLNSDGTRSFYERYGYLTNRYGANATLYGPELMFGTYLGDTLSDDVLLLKVVQGGTDLRVAWRSPGVEANTENNYTEEELAKESLYGYMINFIQQIQDPQVLTSYFPQYADKTIEIAGFIWFQGWNDGFNPINKAQYQTNFYAFLNDIRYDLSLPELPIVVIQSHVGEPEDEVQTAQAQVVEMLDHAELAISDDLSGYYHFDNAAHLVIGHRAYQALEPMLELIPVPEGPEGYTYCADQGESYTFNETVDVAFGADGSFNYLYGVTGTISFTTTTFGNPLPDEKKYGFYKISNPDPTGPEGYTYCAEENASYDFTETVDVAFGADGSFNYLYGVTGTVTFNTGTFGDPLPGVEKYGFYKNVNSLPVIENPTNFKNVDIGDVALPGSTSYDNGIYTVTGAGWDIYGESDEFHFVYWKLIGNGSITSRVVSITETGPWAKAGVMIRESLDPQSPEAAVVVTATQGTVTQWRTEFASTTGWQKSNGEVAPWIHLKREGDTFYYYQSVDGQTWTLIHTNTIVMTPEVFIGLCVTAHDETLLNTAEYDNLRLTGVVNGWIDGPGSSPGSEPLAYLHQRYANEDISGYEALLSITDTQADEDFYIYPEFNEKQITVTLNEEIFITSPNVSISFKFQPDELDQENILLSSPDFFRIQQESTNAVTSTFYDNGTFLSTISNPLSTLKNHSGNHFAAILTPDSHKTYFNGALVETVVDPDALCGQKAVEITIGPYPGKIWDIKIYNRELSESEIMEDAKYFTDGVYKPEIAPDPAYPNGLVGVYRTEWWPLDENLEPGETPIPLETYEYYLFAQERATKYFYFKAGMVAMGREDEYIGLEPDTDLILSSGIRSKFVRSFSFDNPQTVSNSDYWLHENFHSYQARLGGYTGVRCPKWYLEATASWGPDLLFPGSYDSLMAYYTMAPHMPLWINQNAPVEDLAGWQYKGGHQYGAGVFLWYLTTYPDKPDLIGRVFNDPLGSSSPQEVMYNLLGTDPETGDPLMRSEFAEFAAHTITWDYGETGELLKIAEQGGLNRIISAKGLTEEEADNRFPAVYDAQGTANQWTAVPADHTPGSWAYNAYKCENVQAGTYTIEFQADTNNIPEALYEIRAVVHNTQTDERTYYKHNTIVNGEIAIMNTIETGANDTLYLIVATVPDIFSDDTIRYPYQYKIYCNE